MEDLIKVEKEKVFGRWKDGDAVGQFYYQFLNNEKTSFGLNYGIRSVYSGSGPGGLLQLVKANLLVLD